VPGTKGGGTGAACALAPHFHLWGGLAPPLFFLNIISLSNTIRIKSSDNVNRLMKKTLQNFRSILSILFLIYYLWFGRIS